MLVADIHHVSLNVSDTGDTGVRETFMLDPDGNRLEFTQPDG